MEPNSKKIVDRLLQTIDELRNEGLEDQFILDIIFTMTGSAIVAS